MTNSNVNGPEEDISETLDELLLDDDFLTQLSRGTDPSGGTDPLAELLLSLQDEVNADMPAAPTLEELGVVLPVVADAEPETGGVIDLGAERKKRRGPSKIASAFIGAAAATLLIAAGGSAIYAAKEGSVLYGLNQQLFGATTDQAAVVELASKLEEANSLTKSGDVEGAREILAEAQALVDQLHAKESPAVQPKPEKTQSVQSSPTTVTVTATPENQEPVTTTVTVTVEPAAPIVAPPQTQAPQPTASVEPPAGDPQPSAPAEPPLEVPDEYR